MPASVDQRQILIMSKGAIRAKKGVASTQRSIKSYRSRAPSQSIRRTGSNICNNLTAGSSTSNSWQHHRASACSFRYAHETEISRRNDAFTSRLPQNIFTSSIWSLSLRCTHLVDKARRTVKELRKDAQQKTSLRKNNNVPAAFPTAFLPSYSDHMHIYRVFRGLLLQQLSFCFPPSFHTAAKQALNNTLAEQLTTAICAAEGWGGAHFAQRSHHDGQHQTRRKHLRPCPSLTCQLLALPVECFLATTSSSFAHKTRFVPKMNSSVHNSCNTTAVNGVDARRFFRFTGFRHGGCFQMRPRPIHRFTCQQYLKQQQPRATTTYTPFPFPYLQLSLRDTNTNPEESTCHSDRNSGSDSLVCRWRAQCAQGLSPVEALQGLVEQREWCEALSVYRICTGLPLPRPYVSSSQSSDTLTPLTKIGKYARNVSGKNQAWEPSYYRMYSDDYCVTALLCPPPYLLTGQTDRDMDAICVESHEHVGEPSVPASQTIYLSAFKTTSEQIHQEQQQRRDITSNNSTTCFLTSVRSLVQQCSEEGGHWQSAVALSQHAALNGFCLDGESKPAQHDHLKGEWPSPQTDSFHLKIARQHIAYGRWTAALRAVQPWAIEYNLCLEGSSVPYLSSCASGAMRATEERIDNADTMFQTSSSSCDEKQEKQIQDGAQQCSTSACAHHFGAHFQALKELSDKERGSYSAVQAFLVKCCAQRVQRQKQAHDTTLLPSTKLLLSAAMQSVKIDVDDDFTAQATQMDVSALVATLCRHGNRGDWVVAAKVLPKSFRVVLEESAVAAGGMAPPGLPWSPNTHDRPPTKNELKRLLRLHRRREAVNRPQQQRYQQKEPVSKSVALKASGKYGQQQPQERDDVVYF